MKLFSSQVCSFDLNWITKRSPLFWIPYLQFTRYQKDFKTGFPIPVRFNEALTASRVSASWLCADSGENKSSGFSEFDAHPNSISKTQCVHFPLLSEKKMKSINCNPNNFNEILLLFSALKGIQEWMAVEGTMSVSFNWCSCFQL